VLNVGTGAATQITHLAETVARLVGRGTGVNFEAARPGDVQRATADVARVSAALDWRASHDLEQGLSNTLAWWRTQTA
jgi:UDP-glucose 4-epimerase